MPAQTAASKTSDGQATRYARDVDMLQQEPAGLRGPGISGSHSSLVVDHDGRLRRINDADFHKMARRLAR